ncbi:MAG: signal peptidase II [Oscillospiraceae bacterium]|jgi:signal peptidase II|nr:signal peptidase II [Oscillospiraceae bacterium]
MLYFIFAALAAVLDQLLKHWAAAALSGGGIVDLIPGVIHLTYVENTGAAFSILSNMRWALVAVSAVCVVVLAFVLIRYRASVLCKLGLAAVLGGAAGNMIDRVLTGRVVDMFELEFMNFAVFNVADCFITVGGLVFCVSLLLSPGAKREQGAAESPPPDAEDAILTETRILEDFDLERRLSEHDDEHGGS